MPLTALPRARAQQPLRFVGLDTRNPLTRGLVVACVPGQAEYLSGTMPIVSGGFVVEPGIGGMLAKAPAAAAPGYVLWDVPDINLGTDPYTIAVLGKPSTQNTLVTHNFLGAQLNTFSLGASGFSATLDNNSSATFPYAVPADFHVGAAHRIGSTIFPYLDGVAQATKVTGTRTQTITGILVGRDTTQNNLVNTQTALLLLWNRALSAGEHAEIARNPWQVFAPRPMRVYFEAAGGGGGTEFVITPSGGVAFSGSVTLLRGKVFTSSGGVTFGGTATYETHSAQRIITPSGGVVFSGTADVIFDNQSQWRDCIWRHGRAYQRPSSTHQWGY